MSLSSQERLNGIMDAIRAANPLLDQNQQLRQLVRLTHSGLKVAGEITETQLLMYLEYMQHVVSKVTGADQVAVDRAGNGIEYLASQEFSPKVLEHIKLFQELMEKIVGLR